MKFHRQDSEDAEPALLWILLPGAYMKPQDFLQAGFAEAVRSRRLPHEIVLLEATIPEVADGSALGALQEFLTTDPRACRCPVGLAGISLGAHLALACLARACGSAREQDAAARVATACLLAPYLGPYDVVDEARAGAGLRDWQPAAGADDIDRRIWHWLQTGPAALDKLYLGYGREDRFARAHALMAQVLPPQRVDVQPGGHDWPTWAALWNRYLDHRHVHA
jgi:hypothetical protein